MDRRAMKFGSHYLPAYVPELDGPLPEFYQKMFVRLEDLRATCVPDLVKLPNLDSPGE